MDDAPLVSTEAIFAALVEWDIACRRQAGWRREALHLGTGPALSVQRSIHHRCNLMKYSRRTLDDMLTGSGTYDDYTPHHMLDFEVWYPGDEDPTNHVNIHDLVKEIQARGGLLPLKVQAVLNRLNNPGEHM